jgi:hypothetical protein
MYLKTFFYFSNVFAYKKDTGLHRLKAVCGKSVPVGAEI